MNARPPVAAARGGAALLLPLLTLLALGCASGPPRLDGAAGTSPAPGTPWTPPASAEAPPATSGPSIPHDEIATRLAGLTLGEVVDLALANSPATREAWADAKAAAANYGAARGTRLPTLDGNVALARGNGANTQNRTGDWSTTYGPGATLSWQLLDFGGRAGRVEAARQGLLAADWTHNAVIQDAVLDVVAAYYGYGGAKAVLEAGRVAVAEGDSRVAAAGARHGVGLATIADVLQARTARAQAKLDLQAAEGRVRTTRGALVVSMGYPANTPCDVEIGAPEVPVDGVTHAVDELIAGAVSARPDLKAARAQALAAAARVRSARSSLLPSLSVSGAASRLWTDGGGDPVERASGALTLSVPLFGGFSGRHELARAQAEAEAAAERARGFEQRVVHEIFVAHSDFLTAGERVKTADELLASAEASEEVALGRYREGVGDMLDLLSAQRTLASARAQRIDARLGWFTALAQLARDAGVLGLRGANPLAPDHQPPEVTR